MPLGCHADVARVSILHKQEGRSRTCVTVRCLSAPCAQTSYLSPSCRNPPLSGTPPPPRLKMPNRKPAKLSVNFWLVALFAKKRKDLRMSEKGGWVLRGVAFMTVLTVLAVFWTAPCPPLLLLQNTVLRGSRDGLTVLVVSAVVAVSVVTAKPLKLDPPSPWSWRLLFRMAPSQTLSLREQLGVSCSFSFWGAVGRGVSFSFSNFSAVRSGRSRALPASF